MYRTLITPRRLLGAALLLTATSTLAAPRVLHTFGAAGSQRPHLPPSYLTADDDAGLYGVTVASDGPNGTYYSLALPDEGGGLQSSAFEAAGVGGLYTGLVASGDGDLVLGSNPFFGTGPTVFRWTPGSAPVNAVSDPADPTADPEEGYGGDFQPRGLFAADGDGNVYLGGGSARTGNGLFRLTPEGRLDQLVDFENYYEEIDNTHYYHKGQYPAALVVDRDAGVLYGINVRHQSDVSGDPGAVPDGDETAGTLFRVDLSEAQADGNTPVTVLHTFALNAEGGILSSDSGQQALVQAGDRLYGTTTEALWRYRPGDPDSFALVHTFGENADDGDTPWGPLVVAEDGAVYGTTRRTTDGGAGTLFRVTPAGEGDDNYKVLHVFDVETDGALPVGLVPGPVADGTQTLYGATARGGNAGDTLGTSAGDLNDAAAGYGTLYAWDLALPADIRISADPQNLTLGDSTTLSWTVIGGVNCVGEGDWAGNKALEGSETLTPDLDGDYTYTLTCESDGGTASNSVTVTVAPQDSGSGGGDTGGGSSGGGGSLPLAALGLFGLLLARRRR
jgi:uncharacterized protein (TIGR03382 family)